MLVKHENLFKACEEAQVDDDVVREDELMARDGEESLEVIDLRNKIQKSTNAAPGSIRNLVQLNAVEQESDREGLSWTHQELHAIRNFRSALDELLPRAPNSTHTMEDVARDEQMISAQTHLRDVFDRPTDIRKEAFVKQEPAWHPKEWKDNVARHCESCCFTVE